MPTPTLHASQKTKKTAIGEIPVDWRTRELGALSKIVSGGTPHKGQAAYWRGSIPWFSAKDLKKFWTIQSTRSAPKVLPQIVGSCPATLF